jgi:hypothetical protein
MAIIRSVHGPNLGLWAEYDQWLVNFILRKNFYLIKCHRGFCAQTAKFALTIKSEKACQALPNSA